MAPNGARRSLGAAGRPLLAAALLAGAARAGGAQPLAALDTLRARVTRAPDDLPARTALAAALVAAGRQLEAIGEYEAATRRAPSDTALLARLAQLYTWNSRPQQATAIYERILAVAPEDLATRRLLAQQYGWQQMPAKAMEQHREILRRRPGDVDAGTKLAQQLIWTDRAAEAVPLLADVVTATPDSAGPRMLLARALAATGRGAEARPHLARVVRAEPANTEALLLLAELERWSGGWDDARTRLRRVVALDPTNRRARELLGGLRREHGPQAQSGVVRTTDANRLTIEEIPLRAEVEPNRRWLFGADVTRRRLASGLTADQVTGNEIAASARFAFSPAGSALLALGRTAYSSGWSPATARFQLSQRFADRLYTTARLVRVESREGVRAVQQRIATDRAEAEVYFQASPRASVSGTMQRIGYSDDNVRVVAAAFASWRFMQRAPGLTLYLSDAYEDTRRIYPTAVPYWTPDRLNTASARLAAEQPIGRALRLRGNLGVASQTGVTSSVYGARLELAEAGYHRLLVEFERLGSRVYFQRRTQAIYQYRF